MTTAFVFLLGRDKLLTSGITGRTEKNFNHAMRMNKKGETELRRGLQVKLENSSMKQFSSKQKMVRFCDGWI